MPTKNAFNIGTAAGNRAFFKSFERKMDEVKDKTVENLLLAGTFIEGESRNNSPVKTGALKAGHYTQAVSRDPKRPIVEIGATAKYAGYVHEKTWANFKVGGALFLLKAVQDNVAKILEIASKGLKV